MPARSRLHQWYRRSNGANHSDRGMGPLERRLVCLSPQMILLDTHVVVWLMIDRDRLSIRSREAILRARVEQESIAYSSVTIYEIVYSVHRKRLPLRVKVTDFIAEIWKRLRPAPLTNAIAACAAGLPEPFQGDPMDRIIAATAIVESCPLITANTIIRSLSAMSSGSRLINAAYPAPQPAPDTKRKPGSAILAPTQVPHAARRKSTNCSKPA